MTDIELRKLQRSANTRYKGFFVKATKCFVDFFENVDGKFGLVEIVEKRDKYTIMVHWRKGLAKL